MSRNGSGVYTSPVNSWNPQINGALATGPDFNSQLADIANALTQSVSADGQTPITGNINMNGNKLKNLSPGINAGDSLQWQQLFSQGIEQVIASAATMDIGAQNSCFLNVTGAVTVTSLGANYNGPRYMRMAGAVTFTNSTTLICPGGLDVTTAAADIIIAIPKATAGTSDGWYIFQNVSAVSIANILRSQTYTAYPTNFNAIFTASISGTVMTVSAISSGVIGVGQSVVGAAAGTLISSLGTGTGGVGTYNINNSQTVVSTTLRTNLAPNFSITPVPPITSYAQNQRFNVTFGSDGTTGSNTLNISALGAKNLKQFDLNGAKQPAQITSGLISDIIYDGTDFILLDATNQFFPISIRQAIQFGPTTGSPAVSSLIPQSQVGRTLAAGVVLKFTDAATLISVANGFNADGSPLNVNWFPTADITVPNLTASSICYIWVDALAKTAGFVTVQDTDQPGGTIPVTSGQYTFDYIGYKMYLGNGATASQSNRIIVAEVDTNGTVVTAIRCRGYMGAYESGWSAVAANGTYNFTHNVGSTYVNYQIKYRYSPYSPTVYAPITNQSYDSVNNLNYGAVFAFKNKISITIVTATFSPSPYNWPLISGDSTARATGDYYVVIKRGY